MHTQRLMVLTAALVLALAACSDPQPETVPGPVDGVVSTPTVDTDGRRVAEWRFVGEKPDPQDLQFEVQVAWIACTSAAEPEDPQPVVEYGPETVTLTVWAIPPEGDAFECPSNPSVPVTVRLTEPLGDREVVPGPEQPY